ncbi:hypothetical protein EPN96_08975 [bacterium]|nr:MAG: hypothetical protein EPN96_08975 [bacterium]
MKKIAATIVLALFATLLLCQGSLADEIKAVAVITKIELAADGASAVVALKENKTDAVIEVLVTDDLTLDKFKDHRIVVGDEIRLKYQVEDGKNISKYFRKTAGC